MLKGNLYESFYQLCKSCWTINAIGAERTQKAQPQLCTLFYYILKSFSILLPGPHVQGPVFQRLFPFVFSCLSSVVPLPLVNPYSQAISCQKIFLSPTFLTLNSFQFQPEKPLCYFILETTRANGSASWVNETATTPKPGPQPNGR